MSGCDDVITNLLNELRRGTHCEPLDSERVLVALPHTFADGDTLEVLVTVRDDRAVVSDFGATCSRLDQVGVDLAGEGVSAAIVAVAKGYGVEHLGGELRAVGSATGVGELVLRLSDVMLQVDALRVLRREPRGARFATRLVEWLEHTALPVRRNPMLLGRSTRSYRLTAAVGELDVVYVQAVTATSQGLETRSVEHAYTAFADIDGAIPPHQKLAVLGETNEAFEGADLALLETVCHVAAWWDLRRLESYVAHPVPSAPRRLFNQPVQLLPLE